MYKDSVDCMKYFKKYDKTISNDKSRNGQKSDLRRDNLITVLLRSNMETPHSLWQHAQNI